MKTHTVLKPLTEEQHGIVFDLSRSMSVTASAGTGKTEALTRRYLHILDMQKVHSLDEIIAITFTEKAANEMKERIRGYLYSKSKTETTTPIWQQWIQQMHRARISTIHSFCASLLREYPMECGVDPDFSIVESREYVIFVHQLITQSLLTLIEKPVQMLDIPFHSLKDSIISLLEHFSYSELTNIFTYLYKNEASLSVESIPRVQYLLKNPDAFKNHLEQRIHQVGVEMIVTLMEYAEVQKTYESLRSAFQEYDYQQTEFTKKLYQWYCLFEKLFDAHFQQSLPDSSSTKAMVMELLERCEASLPGGTAKSFEKVVSSEAIEQIRRLLKQIKEWVQPYKPYFNGDAHQEFSHYGQLGKIIQTFYDLKTFATTMEGGNAALYKQQNLGKKLTFDDLQTRAHQLLTSPNHRDIQQHIRQRFRFLLVDEVQDIDEIQRDILRFFMDATDQSDSPANTLLPNFFMVGDKKQSIYKFRGANVSTYTDLVDQLKDPLSERSLTYNFRSKPSLVHMVNRAFLSIMGTQPQSFSSDSSSNPSMAGGAAKKYRSFYQEAQAKRAIGGTLGEDSTIPSCEWVFRFKQGKSLEKNQEALLMAQRIKQILVDSPPLIYEKVSVEAIDGISEPGKPVINPANETQEIAKASCSPGDVAVLFRSYSDMEFMIQAFREVDLPYKIMGGRGFFHLMEWDDIFYLLRFIANPEDEFACMVLLRSPFCGLSDSSIMMLADHDRRYSKILHAFKAVHEPDQDPCLGLDPQEKQRLLDFKAIITRYYYDSNSHKSGFTDYPLNAKPSPLYLDRFPLVQILERLLDDFQYWHYLDAIDTTGQKKANVKKGIAWVRRLEEHDHLSIHHLLDLWEEQKNQDSDMGEATLYRDEHHVSFLTIHKAKGLEFPIVALPFQNNVVKGLVSKGTESSLIIKSEGFGCSLRPSQKRSPSAVSETEPGGDDVSQIKPFESILFHDSREWEKDQTLEENKRLLYVALTRASDYLLLGATLDPKDVQPSSTGCYRWAYPLEKKRNNLQWLLEALSIPPDFLQSLLDPDEDTQQAEQGNGSDRATMTVVAPPQDQFSIFHQDGISYRFTAAVALCLESKTNGSHQAIDLKSYLHQRFSKVKPLTLSATALVVYQRCPRRFFYKFIQRIRESSESIGDAAKAYIHELSPTLPTHIPPDSHDDYCAYDSLEKVDKTPAQVPLNLVGNIVHKLLEVHAEDADVLIPLVLYYLEQERLTILSNPTLKDKMIDTIRPMIKNFMEHPVFQEIKSSMAQFPLLTFSEFPFFASHHGVFLEGSIDKLYYNPERQSHSLMDYKTNRFHSKSPKELHEKNKEYSVQMMLYSFLMEHLLGPIEHTYIFYLSINQLTDPLGEDSSSKPLSADRLRADDIDMVINTTIEDIQTHYQNYCTDLENHGQDAGGTQATQREFPAHFHPQHCFFCGYWMCEKKQHATSL